MSLWWQGTNEKLNNYILQDYDGFFQPCARDGVGDKNGMDSRLNTSGMTEQSRELRIEMWKI